MELCNAGSLEKAVSDGRLSRSDANDVDLELLCLTLLEVAAAMDYLHSMQITHRDLKLGNVLLKAAPVTEVLAFWLLHPLLFCTVSSMPSAVDCCVKMS